MLSCDIRLLVISLEERGEEGGGDIGRKGVKKRCGDKWRDTLPPIYLFCILDSSSHLLYLHGPTNNKNQ